jgi:FkbM family methyltransferase
MIRGNLIRIAVDGEFADPRAAEVMTQTVSQVTLPNGKPVFAAARLEAATVYDQVQGYFLSDLELNPGDTILDVGANIGLFMLSAFWRTGGDVTVYGFEPIPPVFDALRKNAELYGHDRLRVFPLAVGSEEKETKFTYYSLLSAISTAYADGWRDELAEAASRNSQSLPPVLRSVRWLPSPLRRAVVGSFFRLFVRPREVQCKMATLSRFIEENRIDRIDLLKIDVERSEWDVLSGIEPGHWLRIKQAIIEVHDIDNRLESVTSLLRSHGLDPIRVEQENAFKDSAIYNVFARAS